MHRKWMERVTINCSIQGQLTCSHSCSTQWAGQFLSPHGCTASGLSSGSHWPSEITFPLLFLHTTQRLILPSPHGPEHLEREAKTHNIMFNGQSNIFIQDIFWNPPAPSQRRSTCGHRAAPRTLSGCPVWWTHYRPPQSSAPHGSSPHDRRTALNTVRMTNTHYCHVLGNIGFNFCIS